MRNRYSMPGNALGQLPQARFQRGPIVGQMLPEVEGDYINPYTAAQYSFNAGLVATRIVAANMRRTYLLLQNLEAAGGNPIYVGVGVEPTIANGFLIAPDGGFIEFIGGAGGGGYCPRSDIYVISTGPAIGVALEGGMIPREQLEKG